MDENIYSEIEHCSVDVSNENMSDSNSDVDVTGDFNYEKEKEDIEDNEKNNEKNTLITSNTDELGAKMCSIDDEPWAIEEDSNDSDESLSEIQECHTVLDANSANLKPQETGKKNWVGYKKLKNLKSAVISTVLSNEIIEKLEAEDESCLPFAKKLRLEEIEQFDGSFENHSNQLINDDIMTGLINEEMELFNQPDLSKINFQNVFEFDQEQFANSGYSSTDFGPSTSTKTNEKLDKKIEAIKITKYMNSKTNDFLKSIENEKNQEEKILNPDDRYNYDIDGIHISSPNTTARMLKAIKAMYCDSLDPSIKSVDSSCSKSSEIPSCNYRTKNHYLSDETIAELLLEEDEKRLKSQYSPNYYNQLDTDYSFEPIEKIEETDVNETKKDSENVEVSLLEEGCSYGKDVAENIDLGNNDKVSQVKNVACFVEDPDIVNPDIKYNIDLNQHFKKMESLIQKILKTPEDLKLIEECKKLPPVPNIDHICKVITKEERKNFSEGISEWEYDIDHDDWNKIMVKRAVVFSAHAGFDIASEESLYVLADVAIDYIRKIASIMKKNFDDQSGSSSPTNVDPINMSLHEIGVNDGIEELIRHFEIDVFGRRKRLLEKCENLQTIINQYIAKMTTDSKIKNKKSNEKDLGETHSTKDETIIKDNTSDKVFTEIKSTTEDMITETLSTSEEVTYQIKSTTEKFSIGIHSKTKEKLIVNTEIKYKEPIYINKKKIEVKVNTPKPKNMPNIKTNAVYDCIKETNDHKNPLIDKVKQLKPILIKSVGYDNMTCNKKYRSMTDDERKEVENSFDVSKICLPDREKRLDDFGFPSDLEKSKCNNDKYVYDTNSLLELVEDVNPISVVPNKDPVAHHSENKLSANDLELLECAKKNKRIPPLILHEFETRPDSFNKSYDRIEDDLFMSEDWYVHAPTETSLEDDDNFKCPDNTPRFSNILLTSFNSRLSKASSSNKNNTT